MKCALIGFGYWGRNIARTLFELADSGILLQGICELDSQKCAQALTLAQDFGKSIKIYQNLDELLADDVSCVFVATPPDTHFWLGEKILQGGKNAFIEKPLCLDSESARRLYEIALAKNLTLYCDHIFLCASAVLELKNRLEQLGEIVRIEAIRQNVGHTQGDSSVLWDLGVHDLSIVEFLIGLDVKSARLLEKTIQDGKNTYFQARMFLNSEPSESSVEFELISSWIGDKKQRTFKVFGTKKNAIYDDVAADKLLIIDNFSNNVQKVSLDSEMSLCASIKRFAKIVQTCDFSESCALRTHTIKVIETLELLESLGH